MEKIISINLAGRVIPIEDGAYASLKQYLESLRRYFAAEEGSEEIMTDIESRIAELMAQRLSNGAPAINGAHVADTIATMGRAEDFAAEDESATAPAAPPVMEKRRFVRDTNDKIAGGVCSGLAAYLNVDPALVRIVFALLTIGGWGSGLILYFLLWIFVPAGKVPTYRGRRLYRNSDDKWLGGVASGLAAYFNKETWLFRIAFAAPVLLSMLTGSMHWVFHSSLFFGSFFGTLVLVYIVLWIVLPVAVTEFQKMEMRGERIDIGSIRDNVVADLKDRTTAFRAEAGDAATRLSSRGRAFAAEARAAARPVASRGGQIIVGLIKAFALFIGGCIAFGLFMGMIVYFFGGFSVLANNFILQTPAQRTLAWISVLLLLGVPMLALLTAIVRRLTKMRGGSTYFRTGFAILWVAGIVCGAALGSSLSEEFRSREYLKAEVATAQPHNGKLVLRVPEDAIEYTNTIPWLHGDDRGWDLSNDMYRTADVSIRVTRSPDSQYHVIMTRSSMGKNRQEARRRAEALSYPVQNARGTDSILDLGNAYTVSKAQGWRGQDVALEIQVPAGKKLRFDESVDDKLTSTPFIHVSTFQSDNGYRRRRWRSNWNDYLDAGVDYAMKEDGTLTDEAGQRIGEPFAYSRTASRHGDKEIDSLERAMEKLEQRRDALRDTEDDDE